MDLGFFADPDPEFKNPDPDLSIFCFNKLMGSAISGRTPEMAAVFFVIGNSD